MKEISAGSAPSETEAGRQAGGDWEVTANG